MRNLKTLIWAVAGGLPICAAILWVGGAAGIGSSDPGQALAQTTDAPTSEMGTNQPVRTQVLGTSPQQTETPGAGTAYQSRRELLDFLRWQNLSPEDRRMDRQVQSEQEVEEWARLLEFLRDNSHNRYLLVLRVAPQPGSVLRNKLMQQWLVLSQQQRTNPALFDIHVQEFKEEDVVIGLAAEMRRARRANDRDSLKTLRKKIRDEAVKLVELNFAERELRIKNAQELVDQQQKLLEQDRQTKDHLADERGRQLMQQFGMNNFAFPSSRPSN